MLDTVPGRGQPRRLLSIDDDQLTRQVLAVLVSHSGTTEAVHSLHDLSPLAVALLPVRIRILSALPVVLPRLGCISALLHCSRTPPSLVRTALK